MSGVTVFRKALSDYRDSLPKMDEDDFVRINKPIDVIVTFQDESTQTIQGYTDWNYRCDDERREVTRRGSKKLRTRPPEMWNWYKVLDLTQVLGVRIEVPPPILGEDDEYDEEPDLA